MHFLYTGPRYHTNQHFPVKALLDAGHDVSFLALTCGQSEEYSALTPTVLGFSPLYDMYLRVIGLCRGKDLVGTPPEGGSRVNGMPPIVKFWREVRRRRPSVVIIRDPFKPYGRLAIAVAALTGTRSILYTQQPMHGPRGFRRRRKPLTLLIIRTAKSPWMTPVLGLADRYAAAKRCHYVPFVIEPQTHPRDKAWFKDDAFNILAIGKFQSRKNHRMFLDVIKLLSTRYPIRATIIGECSTSDHQSELENIKQHGHRLGIASRVEFKVNLSFSEVQSQIQQHDVFVLASRNDQVGVSLLEAMSHSLPVICSDSSGAQSYVRPGENGFVFRTDDTDHLSVCLDQILGDRDQLIQMGTRSYRLIETEHQPKRYVEALVAWGT
jgi:glycosyltransferase involved in cell wall biosynthesis